MYYAQCNIFGIWIDLRYHPFTATHRSWDSHLGEVELWLDNYINGKGPKTEEVVKEYE